METTEKEILRGGQFLVKETNCEDVFTPEDFTEEQKMMRDSVIEFNDREIIPFRYRFEAKDYALILNLLFFIFLAFDCCFTDLIASNNCFLNLLTLFLYHENK